MHMCFVGYLTQCAPLICWVAGSFSSGVQFLGMTHDGGSTGQRYIQSASHNWHDVKFRQTKTLKHSLRQDYPLYLILKNMYRILTTMQYHFYSQFFHASVNNDTIVEIHNFIGPKLWPWDKRVFGSQRVPSTGAVGIVILHVTLI